jgi:DNA-binding XRE family transcriptional regulator
MKKGKRGPYKEVDLVQVEAHAARGMTQEQIAAALGISDFTLYARKRESSEFSEAIKRGQAKGIGIITNELFESARSRRPGNVTAQIFF